MFSYPELGPDGIVLWRLFGLGSNQLRCEVTCAGDQLTLAVREVGTGDTVFVEPYPDIEPLLHRADRTRERCLAAGWRDRHDQDKTVRP